MWVSSRTPIAPATVPGFRLGEPILLGFFAGSAAAVGLAPGRKLAEVVRAAFGRHRAALAPQSGSGRCFDVGEQIVTQGQRRGQQFAAPRRAALGKVGRRQDEVGFGDERAERGQFSAGRCHRQTIRGRLG